MVNKEIKDEIVSLYKSFKYDTNGDIASTLVLAYQVGALRAQIKDSLEALAEDMGAN